MMGEKNRLSRVFINAEQVPFDNSSRIVLFSDCHRGDGSWADDFFKNRNIYYAALTYYFNRNFTYIEIGDGDELWKNKEFSEIVREYGDVFRLISRFIKEGRFYSIYGNHDYEKKKWDASRQRGPRSLEGHEIESFRSLMGIKHREGLILWHKDANCGLFLVHGHQADFFNDQLKWLSRFLVRYLWRPLEILGLNDPTSPARNNRKMAAVERKLLDWVGKERQPLIAGHTHRSVFPAEGGLPYFNDGSCVHPRCITAIEIRGSTISLVKWSVMTKPDRTLYVGREVLEAPVRLSDYFQSIVN